MKEKICIRIETSLRRRVEEYGKKSFAPSFNAAVISLVLSGLDYEEELVVIPSTVDEMVQKFVGLVKEKEEKK